MFTQPQLHAAIPMESRVQVDASIHLMAPTGTVIGVASMHVIFIYIVFLDQTLLIDDEWVRAITVPGSQLQIIA